MKFEPVTLIFQAGDGKIEFHVSEFQRHHKRLLAAQAAANAAAAGGVAATKREQERHAERAGAQARSAHARSKRLNFEY